MNTSTEALQLCLSAQKKPTNNTEHNSSTEKSNTDIKLEEALGRVIAAEVLQPVISFKKKGQLLFLVDDLIAG